MIGFGFNTTNLASEGGGTNAFTPLDYSPTFWYDYNDYPLGTMAAVSDKTGNYTATSEAASEIVLRNSINVYENIKANAQAVQYNNDFMTVFRDPHTHVITYEPKEISTPLNALYASANAGNSYHYGFYHSTTKLRIYMNINNVLTQIDTVLDVFTNLDTKYIEVYIAQTGMRVKVNGVEMALTATDVTNPALLSTWNNLPNLTMGARKLPTAVGLNSNAYFGDHLLFPRELTLTESTNVLNYFI